MDMYNWGTRGQAIVVNPVRNTNAGGTKRGSVLILYIIKRSREVLEMKRCNERMRMQQSRACGAVNVSAIAKSC